MDIVEISKDELERVYTEQGIVAASEHFGVSMSNLYRLLDQAGIPRKTEVGERKPKRRLKLVD